MQLSKGSDVTFARLQEFHYHPRGSDTCFPCDCYPVGSFSRSCDAETGQCQCRPGVIGRQCNACDNPFAEVTNSGCEGERTFHYVNSFLIYSLLFMKSSCCWWLLVQLAEMWTGGMRMVFSAVLSSLQSSMTAAQRPSLRGSGGHGQSSTCLRRYPAPKALSVRTPRPALTGAAVISTLHPWTGSHRFATFLALCRCSHQTLWCRTRMAGAWTLQLHLASICGAQCCCMWRL